MRNEELRISDCGFQISNLRFEISDSGPQISNLESRISDSRSEIPGYAVRGLKSAIRNPQSAILRSAFRISALAALALWVGGCARLQAPIEPAAISPATGQQLAAAMQVLYPQANAFYARMDLSARGRFFLGGDDLTVQMLCGPPDRVVVQIGKPGLVGGIVRLTQSGAGVSIFLNKEGRHYKGSIEELDAHPELFFGIEPLDLVRVLTAGRDAADALAGPPSERWTLRKPSCFRANWVLRAKLDPRRSVEYRIRKRDGLVVEARLLDAQGRWTAHAQYRAYERFGAALFPSRFDLRLRSAGARARIEVRKLEPDRKPRDGDFSLAPPPGAESGALRDLLRRLAP